MGNDFSTPTPVPLGQRSRSNGCKSINPAGKQFATKNPRKKRGQGKKEMTSILCRSKYSTKERLVFASRRVQKESKKSCRTKINITANPPYTESIHSASTRCCTRWLTPCPQFRALTMHRGKKANRNKNGLKEQTKINAPNNKKSIHPSKPKAKRRGQDMALHFWPFFSHPDGDGSHGCLRQGDRFDDGLPRQGRMQP